ncbi:MAG: sulfotransferase family protein [Alphaproteobacteria bacterium]|nr:MAG: sulfotransferase family protein [Alphaproteobacteria bacterium]
MNSILATELFQKGMTAGQQGRQDQAADFFMKAAEQNSTDPAFLMKVGEILENMQKPNMAANIYNNLIKINPQGVAGYLGFGRVLAQLGNYKSAISCFEHANKLQPGEKTTYARLCKVYWAAGENEKGIAAIKEAFRLGIAPEFYYYYLADHYEKNNRLEELGELLKKGLSVCPEDHSMLILSGAYYFRQGDTQKALENLLKVKVNTENYGLNLRLYFELGRVYDKLGKYQEAFDSYTLGNKFSKAAAQLKQKSTEKGRKFIKNIEGMNFTGWDKVTADTLEGPENNPIFLVGFPRSGTTLLNRILDSHKDIECVEEERLLFATKSVVTTKYGGYFHALKDLSSEQLNELRDHYLERAKKFKKSGKGIYLVDKFPLYVVEIPFIKKIFPQSKIILALRHPCACTLSCFMQNFDLNQAMLNFLNLDDTTSYYAEIMSHWVLFRKELDFDYYPFLYEKLVKDPEKEIRKLVSYLELDWDPDIMNFTQKAKAKGRIKTPSYYQVVKPIYQDSTDRWRNYEKQLAPYLDRLKPFCDAFGYPI